MPSPRSDGRKDLETIEYWLTNKNARATLAPQIAEILRRIYEIYNDKRQINYDKPTFVFCAICGMPLETFDYPGWEQGKRCENSHEFLERTGTITFSTIEEKRDNLSGEMTDKIFNSLIDAWLKGDPLGEGQLHPEIKNILWRFKEKRRP